MIEIDESRIRAVEALVERQVAAQAIPGLSIAVARGGAILYANGFGNRNVGDRLAANPHTLYSVASISKQFTAASVLLLAERGRLSLDDDVTRYFAWLNYTPGVTLRHLLSHTSGIPGFSEIDDFDRRCFVDTSPREVVETVLDRAPAFAPGTDWQYSNTNFVLLGMLIEELAERRYADVLREEVFVPLGLTATGEDSEPVVRGNETVGYTSFCAGPLERARDWHPSWEFGTGGLYSNVLDMVRWSSALRGGSVVNDDAFAAMTTSLPLRGGFDPEYGLGLSLPEIDGVKVVRHAGGLPGISTEIATVPDHDLDVAIFANCDNLRLYLSLARPILALMLGRGGEGVQSASPPGSGLARLQAPPEARVWLERALDDPLSLPLTAKLRRTLKPRHVAAMRAVREYGRLTDLQLIDASRRDPIATFVYRASFERGTLRAALSPRDGGEIDGLAFYRWDLE